MKRLVVLCLLLAAIVVVSSTGSNPAQAFVLCKCGTATNTTTLSRTGASCAAAASALEYALHGTYTCYECRDAVLHSTCTSSGGEDPYFTATGYLTFKCFNLVGNCAIP
jgi:hypothetical protein